MIGHGFRRRLARAVQIAVAVIAGLFAAPAIAAGPEEQPLEIGGVATLVWHAPSAAPQPVVVFSHGMYMCPSQSRYLTRALAQAGYLVIAPRHADSNCDFSIDIADLSRYAMKPSLLWSDRDYRDRADDIRRVVAGLRTDPRWRDRADTSRLALAGHSLGGYTVLGLGGAWPSWQLPGVKAILALSPYSWPFQRSEGLRRLKAPVMFQTGSWDFAFTLPLSALGGGFGQSPSPKYLVEIDGATHLAWTDLGFSGREAIIGYAIAFLDRHVKGTSGSSALAGKLPGVSSYAHQESAD